MKKLDVEALFLKNPQVDRDLVQDTAKKVSEARRSGGAKAEKPVVPPYGGRRMLLDQEGKDRTRSSLHNLKSA